MVEAQKATGKAAKKSVNHWWILVLLALAQFMVVLDVSIVNVMLPTVQRTFHLSEDNLQWIITAYALTFGGFLLLGGRVADLFGRRRVFLIGTVLFALTSLADGLSLSGGMLIGLRGVQGLCAAFMSPAALSIVLVTYREGHGRNVALAVWGAVASGGAAVGLLLGGILTQYLGWRWNFFINVPIGFIVALVAMQILPHHRSEEGHNDLDLPGAVLATGGLILLVFGLVRAPIDGWTAGLPLACFIASLILLVGFVLNERIAEHPLAPLAIFKIRNLVGANLSMLAIAGALFSVFFFSTLYVQEILGYSPVKTGVSFLFIPFIIAAAATNAPRVIKRLGYKPVLMIAPLFTAGGLFWLGHLPVAGHYWSNMVPGMAVMSFGMGFTFVSVLGAATAGVAKNLSGLASGLVNTTQQVGGSLGLAVLTGIAAGTTTRYIQNLHAAPTKAAQAAAAVHGYDVGFYVAALFALAAVLIVSLVLKQQKPAAGPDSLPGV